MNILELKAKQQEIMDTLFFDDENKELLTAQLNQIQGTAAQKLKYMSTILMEIKLNQSARHESLERAKKRYQTSVNAEANLREFIREMMIGFDIKKLEGDECTLSMQKGRESVFIPEDFDAKTLPEPLRTHYPESFKAKKNDINRLLKAGEDVCGLGLIRGDDVMIVR